MKFRIPFAISNLEKLKFRSKFFSSRFRHVKKSKLELYLKGHEVKLTREEYLGIVFRSFVNYLLLSFILISTILGFIFQNLFYVVGFGLAFLFSGFIAFSQLVYPRLFTSRKERKIETNLIFALEDILIQLNSGIPLFDILTNISSSDYGELSEEFKKAVKKISSGEPEAEVLADIGARNHSVFFKRTLWQISNGLKTGSDMSSIIKESIRTLNDEQMIQIQNYGNRLNPLIMMYMLMSVIIPSLSVSFLTVVTSMLGVEANITMGMFIGLFVFVFFFQIMFFGLIKSRRPSLL
jgi:flagellar protein FlaJ|tara:strand:+ start:63 stop:944 length:882 start_codon:yes stop_codon:yes gene_type:complete